MLKYAIEICRKEAIFNIYCKFGFFHPILYQFRRSYLNQFDLILLDPIESCLIQFGSIWTDLFIYLVWSSLIQFDPIFQLISFNLFWSDMMQFEVWTHLIQVDPSWTNFIWFEPNNQSDPTCLIWSSQFGPVWSIFIWFDPNYSNWLPRGISKWENWFWCFKSKQQDNNMIND